MSFLDSNLLDSNFIENIHKKGSIPSEIFDYKFYLIWETLNFYVQKVAQRINNTLKTKKINEFSLSDKKRDLYKWIEKASINSVQNVTEEELAKKLLLYSPELKTVLNMIKVAEITLLDYFFENKLPQKTLTSPKNLSLWYKFFSNDNPIYNVNNKLLKWIMKKLEFPKELKVLELGGGVGSTTFSIQEILLDKTDRLEYIYSDIHPLFIRQVKRKNNFPHLKTIHLNFDKPFEPQGIPKNGVNVVIAVNALHNAYHLEKTLLEIYNSLSSGGYLIISEAVKIYKDQPIALEIIFKQLEIDIQVTEKRKSSGFLEYKTWCNLLQETNFSNLTVYPDLDSITSLYPRCNIVAIVARKA